MFKVKKEKGKGPDPAYNHPPATPNAPPYPVQQGPPLPPYGAPPAYTPAPPPGHVAYPAQPYYTLPANAVPQAYRGQQSPAVPGQPPTVQPGYPIQGAPIPGTALYGQPQYSGTVVLPGVFDAGARFDTTAAPIIPHIRPTAAELAKGQSYYRMGTCLPRDPWLEGGTGTPYRFKDPFKPVPESERYKKPRIRFGDNSDKF